MSIHPRYAEAILRGEKSIEFRKRPVAGDVTHVLVYATRPVGAIVGAFTVAGQETSSPERLWQAFGEIAGMRHDRFMEYYRSHSKGTGIRVGKVFVTCNHVTLKSAFGMHKPPQSFCYVEVECARSLLQDMRPAR